MAGSVADFAGRAGGTASAAVQTIVLKVDALAIAVGVAGLAGEFAFSGSVADLAGPAGVAAGAAMELIV